MANEAAASDFAVEEAASRRFGVRARHGADVDAERSRELAVRRQSRTGRKTAALDVAGECVGECEVQRSVAAGQLRLPD
jgi:hypothetical protein